MPEKLTTLLHHRAGTEFDDSWQRQRATAQEILARFERLEGVVVADAVGMGKTFVALAVAVTKIVSTTQREQVVVLAPAAVANKWLTEWQKFQSLLADGHEIRAVTSPLRTAESLFRALDDAPDQRDHLLIVTHNALTNSLSKNYALNDAFIQLAVVHAATRRRAQRSEWRKRVAKWSGTRPSLFDDRRLDPVRVSALLERSPNRWRDEWSRLTGEELKDDPVPLAPLHELSSVNLDEVRDVLNGLPRNNSGDMHAKLMRARSLLRSATRRAWVEAQSRAVIHLPLLIVDEAHRAKNAQTNFAKLFSPSGAASPSGGVLANSFDRMLFLTATPFELGHSELLQVLRRLGAARLAVPAGVGSLDDRLDRLESALITAQKSGLALDKAWSGLSVAEVDAFSEWAQDSEAPPLCSAAVRDAWRKATSAAADRAKLQQELRPWIIRHEGTHRRRYLPGAAISTLAPNPREGLQVPTSQALAFLLAARAQTVALESNREGGRPLYAYGLASSYDAFLRLDVETRDRDEDSDEPVDQHVAGEVGWYRSQIQHAMPINLGDHPKVAATAERALALWGQGEKVLVFCWYIRTGSVLEKAIQEGVDRELTRRVEAAIPETGRQGLLKHVDVHLRSGAPLQRELEARLRQHFQQAGVSHGVLERLLTVAKRTLRTIDHLARYSHLSDRLEAERLWAGLQGDSPTEVDVLGRWTDFGLRMQSEAASSGLSPVAGLVFDALLGASDEEGDSDGRGALLGGVRRAHGGTHRQVRERLIHTFNTPFAPDVLVASSVLGEGVDLHQECRHVIHHDLDWNPGVLEQRTGRLDRIGSLAMRDHTKVDVYEPYLAGTHDEKMYRVVKDREKWFSVVMGSSSKNTSEAQTDQHEARAPLHPKVAEALALDLKVHRPRSR